MQDIISYYVVPPGNLCIRMKDGSFRQASELETVRFFRMGHSLAPLRGWRSNMKALDRPLIHP